MIHRFEIYTDGSGHADGFGGWCSIITNLDTRCQGVRWGTMVGTTVDRMEMTAILEGLQHVEEQVCRSCQSRQQARIEDQVYVQLRTDRENLAFSIKRVYDRSNSPDLWARFQWYEARMTIQADHVDRETDSPELQLMDLHASTARIVGKTYYIDAGLKGHLSLVMDLLPKKPEDTVGTHTNKESV